MGWLDWCLLTHAWYCIFVYDYGYINVQLLGQFGLLLQAYTTDIEHPILCRTPWPKGIACNNCVCEYIHAIYIIIYIYTYIHTHTHVYIYIYTPRITRWIDGWLNTGLVETLELAFSISAVHQPFNISICISTLPTQHTTFIYIFVQNT